MGGRESSLLLPLSLMPSALPTQDAGGAMSPSPVIGGTPGGWRGGSGIRSADLVRSPPPVTLVLERPTFLLSAVTLGTRTIFKRNRIHETLIQVFTLGSWSTPNKTFYSGNRAFGSRKLS